MEKRDNDVPYSGQEPIQARRAGFLAQRLLQNGSQQFGNWTKIRSIDPNAIECSASNVEFVSQADVDIGNLSFCGSMARPLRQSLKKLFCGYQKMSDALFDLGQLLARLDESHYSQSSQEQ